MREASAYAGSSPRTRVRLIVPRAHGAGVRFIPAHAGETRKPVLTTWITRGSSPRTRVRRARVNSERTTRSVHPRARG